MALVKLNNRGVRSATTFGSAAVLGEMILIKKQTASSDTTISFVDGTSDVVLDDTYKEYLFTFNNIHPETDNTKLEFDFSTDGGSNYSVTKTSTSWRGQHGEDDSSGVQQYDGALDLAQGTANQILGDSGNDNDQALSGYIFLFNPSSTTFVKHYIATSCGSRHNDLQQQYFIAGYGNTTSAIDAVQFNMNSGDIDAGDICLYGIL
jgi:hypothetical protein